MWKVPSNVLKRNSVHLKIFHAQLYKPDLFRCTGLVDLTIPQQPLELDAQRYLVRTNPGLKVLRWHGPNRTVPIKAEDFVHLTRIHTLELAHWEGSGDALGRVLEAVAGSLVKLELGWIQWMANMVHSVDTTNTPPSRNNNNNNNNNTKGLILSRLESFTSTSSQPSSPDPTDLIRCCPNLKLCDLTLTNDIDIIRLSDTLEEHCPKLDTLTVREYRRLQLCERLIWDLGDRQIQNLVHLTVSQIALTKNLTSAIIRHASKLESLSIMVQDVDFYSIVDSAIGTAFLPLYECRRLKAYSLVVSNRRILSRNVWEGLQVDQWGCKGLEQFSLDFWPPPYEGRWSSGMSAKDLFKNCGGAVVGWKMCSDEEVVRVDAYTLQMQKGFFQGLFEAVQRLENLRVVKWNKLVFSRA
jgi:hypothetical protein